MAFNNNNSIAVFSLLLLSISFLTLGVDALKCYRCNSNIDSDCFNVRYLPLELGKFLGKNVTVNGTAVAPTSAPRTQTLLPVDHFLEDCPVDKAGRKPFCRYTTITVIHGEHRRVIRECAYEPAERECYKADNEDHLERVCQCWTDGCNDAGQVSPSIFVVGIMVSASAALLMLAKKH